jgi:hypothetical protein
MDPQAAKQQIVDRIKQAENILVTVSANPTVDQLASCIGLALLLNKMGKSTTAVYSGKTPSTIEFLQPEKTLQQSPDSLRDFIISLDKAKADKLRYKIEDQVVRIFITPYKTKLTQKDLVFSEGDFNVDVIVTLGVLERMHLDTAITAHGRILHDATVIAVSAGQGKAPDLGQINWQDVNASSLAEMLVSLSEAFGSNLIDNQTATAFLTGIVSETDRFSNKKTSPKVMTMSAQLMAAGANQQLIISKLAPPPSPQAPPPNPKQEKPAPPIPPSKTPEPPKPKPEPPKPEPPKPPQQKAAEPKKEEKKKDTTLNVSHKESEENNDEVEINTGEIHIDKQGNLKMIEEDSELPSHDKNLPERKDDEKPGADEEKKSDNKLPEPPPEAEVHIIMPPPSEKKTTSPPEPPKPPLPEELPLSVPPPPIPEQKPPEVIPPPPIPKSDPVLPPVPPLAPPPPKNSAEDLLTLPPPEPVPHIKFDKPLPPHISAQGVAPQTLPLPPVPSGPPPDEHSSHAVLDPLRQPPSMGASFSADTNDGWGGGSNNIPVDPVNNIPMSPNANPAFGAPKTVNRPQAEPGALTPESARQAVESAFSSVPFDPAGHPEERSGAESMGPPLHPPAYGDGTPSLKLPGTPGNSAPPVPPLPMTPPEQAPPPPGPPPFMPPPSL